MTKRLLAACAAYYLTVTVAGIAATRVDPVNQNRSGFALQGYDQVARFQLGKSVRGSTQFAHQ